jgi:hypothetical protein
MKNIYLIQTDKPSKLHLGNSGLVLCDLNFGKNTINGQHIYITSDEEIKEGDWRFDLKDNDFYKTTVSELNEIHNCKKIIITDNKDLIKDGIQKIDDEFLEWFVKNPSCEYVQVIPSEFLADKVIYEIIIPKEPKCTCEKPGDWSCVYCVALENKETLEEAAKNYANIPLHRDIDTEERYFNSNVRDYDAFIAGAKCQDKQNREKIGLLQIELNHTKTLLASCEEALEERDKQMERMYSEEEVNVLLNALEYFTDRVEKGTIRSKTTYKMYKDILEQFKKKQL